MSIIEYLRFLNIELKKNKQGDKIDMACKYRLAIINIPQICMEVY